MIALYYTEATYYETKEIPYSAQAPSKIMEGP